MLPIAVMSVGLGHADIGQISLILKLIGLTVLGGTICLLFVLIRSNQVAMRQHKRIARFAVKNKARVFLLLIGAIIGEIMVQIFRYFK